MSSGAPNPDRWADLREWVRQTHLLTYQGGRGGRGKAEGVDLAVGFAHEVVRDAERAAALAETDGDQT